MKRNSFSTTILLAGLIGIAVSVFAPPLLGIDGVSAGVTAGIAICIFSATTGGISFERFTIRRAANRRRRQYNR